MVLATSNLLTHHPPHTRTRTRQDSVEVTALDDADVPGVTLYISDFKRSIADKLSKVKAWVLMVWFAYVKGGQDG